MQVRHSKDPLPLLLLLVVVIVVVVVVVVAVVVLSLRQKPSLDSFKSNLKTFLSQNCGPAMFSVPC